MGFPSWGGLLLAAALTTAAVAQSPAADDFARYEPPLPEGAVMRIGSERFRLGFESGQAVFSPDGRVIVSASLQYGPGKSPDDGRGHVVEFWEAETGRLLARRPGRKALYSADGLTVAMLNPDGVCVYDGPVPGETPRAVLTRPQPDVAEFALSPDGRTVALAYAVPTARQQRRLPDLAIGVWGDRRVLAWDVPTSRVLWDVPRPPGGRMAQNTYSTESDKPRSLAFSPDGTRLAAAFAQPDGLYLLDATTGKPVHTLSELGWRWDLWFSVDGRSLYASREDRQPRYHLRDTVPESLEVWDVATGRLEGTLELPGPFALWATLTPSADRRWLALGTRSREGVVGVVDLGAALPVWQQSVEGLPRHDFHWPLPALAFSPDGRTVAGALGRCVRQWEADSGDERPTSRRDLPDFTRMAISSDGRWLAAAGPVAALPMGRFRSPHVRRFDAETGRELGRYQTPFGTTIVALAISPDDRWLAACDTNGDLRVWAVDSGDEVHRFRFRNDVQSYFAGLSRDSRRQVVTFSPDGRWLLAASALRLHRLDVANGWAEAPEATIGYDRGVLNTGCFLPDGQRFVAVRHQKIRVFDLADPVPRVLHDLDLDLVIHAATLAPDGESLALIASPRNFPDLEQPTTLIRIDTAEWTERSRTELPDSARIDAALQLTDRVLACGENDGQITLRDLETGAILARHAAHRSGDLQLERTADGRHWVSLGRTLLVWNNRR
jgi:WD40 repeat protein